MGKLIIRVAILLLFIFSAGSAHASYEKLFYFKDNPSARASLTNNIDKIDILAPQVYSIDKSLVPYGSLNQEIKDIIGTHDVKIMPLITNDHFSQVIIHNLLISNEAQDRVINFMIDEAEENNYYGWQFDLEHIKYTDQSLFSSFVEKTHKAFKEEDLALSIAVVVKINNSTKSDWYMNWAGGFDYLTLSQNSDFISIMTYDDPDSKGPTASIPFVKKTLGYILEQKVPPGKISLGIPDYYWSWTTYPRLKMLRSGSYQRLLKIEAENKYTKGFDTKLGVPWIAFKDKNVKYKVWYENKKSFDLKTKLIDAHKLRGFSLWVLGAEDPEIWGSVL